MPRYGMVIDLDRCMGCRACMEACKVENATVEGHFWMKVFRFEEGAYPDVHVGFLPRPCPHCENAPCVKVCPVQARHHQEDGLVLTDFKRCIGCRYCEVACPYGVNFFAFTEPEDSYYLDWNDKALEARTGGAVPPYRNPALDVRHGPGARALLAAVVGLGVYAYFKVATVGHVLTGLTDASPWGLYIIGFVFFVGASAGSTVIGLMIHAFGRKGYERLGARGDLRGGPSPGGG